MYLHLLSERVIVLQTTFLIIACYTIGNFLTAVIVGKLLYKRDIRALGSGNTGARNAGKVFGKIGFILTFLGDGAKGAIAIMLAHWAGYDGTMLLVCLFAATVGHIFPVFYKFHGGKGISTFLGGVLFYEPFICTIITGIFLVLISLIKNFTVAGLAAIATIPFTILMLGRGLDEAAMLLLLVVLICIAHKKDIMAIAKEKVKM